MSSVGEILIILALEWWDFGYTQRVQICLSDNTYASTKINISAHDGTNCEWIKNTVKLCYRQMYSSLSWDTWWTVSVQDYNTAPSGMEETCNQQPADHDSYRLLFGQRSRVLDKFRHDRQLTGTSRQLRCAVTGSQRKSLTGSMPWYFSV